MTETIEGHTANDFKKPLNTPVDGIGMLAGHYFNGMIDEIRLWKEVRTAEQILANIIYPFHTVCSRQINCKSHLLGFPLNCFPTNDLTV